MDWTLTLHPTPAYARDAEMSTEDFTDFVLATRRLDESDPVAAWGKLSIEQARLIAWMAGKSEVRL